MDKKLQPLFASYKKQPVFKAATAIFVVAAIVKIAMLGFEFGQWLKVR